MNSIEVYCVLLLCISYAESLHELCAKNFSADCSKQLWPINQSSNECEIKYYVTDSSACSELSFQDNIDSLIYLGDVRIKPYLWNYKSNGNFVFQYTLFNVSFSNIKWSDMKFRFESMGSSEIKEYKNHCREIFIRSEEMLKNISTLNYDCHWSDQDHRYQNEIYYFDYEAKGSDGVARGKFMFIVPSIKMLSPTSSPEDWLPFVYLNVIDFPKLSIHIVPSEYNLEIERFIIEICLRMDNGNKYNRKNVCTNLSVDYLPGQQEVVYFHRIEKSGNYTFEIIPVSPQCNERTCKSVFGPEIYIDTAEQDRIVYSILWIVLIFVTFWIPIILWLVYGSPTQKFRPNVLVIHPPGNKMDMDVVDLLGQYFQSELHWKVMSKKDIRLTEHHDPYMWCMEVFDKANVILYIVNPYSGEQATVDYVETNIYRNLDQILLKHVRNGTIKCPVVNVVFDHYKTKQIPEELRHMKTFRLLRDWYHLLRFIMHFNIWDKIKHPIPKLRVSKTGRQLCSLLDL